MSVSIFHVKLKAATKNIIRIIKNNNNNNNKPFRHDDWFSIDEQAANEKVTVNSRYGLRARPPAETTHTQEDNTHLHPEGGWTTNTQQLNKTWESRGTRRALEGSTDWPNTDENQLCSSKSEYVCRPKGEFTQLVLSGLTQHVDSAIDAISQVWNQCSFDLSIVQWGGRGFRHSLTGSSHLMVLTTKPSGVNVALRVASFVCVILYVRGAVKPGVMMIHN